MKQGMKLLNKLAVALKPFRVMTDMMAELADLLANRFKWLFNEDATTILSLIAYGLATAVVYLSMTSGLPILVGCFALGLLLSGAALGILQSPTVETRKETIEQIVPYDEWPTDCYGCNRELGEVRGQLVIHKGEGANQLKAVGLCEKCTRTHSTLLDYSDRFANLYDMRDEPEEL